MRIFTILTMTLTLTLFISCASKKTFIPYQRTGEVVYVAQDVPGTMTVRSNAFASSAADAVYYAERNALENIFYKGIPGSPQATPMISDDKAVYKYRDFFSRFFNNGEYRKYITESVPVYQNKTRSGFYITQEITIDIGALRKALEKEGIIRKFGL